MDSVLLIIRVVLAAVFAVAGTGKLLDREGSETAFKDFGVPKFLLKSTSIVLPIAEILIAAAFLFVETSWFAAVASAVLLGAFTAGMLVQYLKGNAPDCHCFGQIHSEPVGKKSIVRNLILFGLAVFLAVYGFEDQGTNIFSTTPIREDEQNLMEIFLGFATVALLGAVVYFLRQISIQQTQIVRRIEMLEILSSGENAREIENLSHPDDGLPIAAPAPKFKLSEVDGTVAALDDLLKNKKPKLLFFVSPGCSPCAALLPEIQDWKTRLGEKFDLIFISSGNRKENTEKFGAFADRILLQKEREVAELFGAQWTPTLVVVNNDGSIGSRPAAGDGAIRKIIEKLIVGGTTDKFYLANGDRPDVLSKLGKRIPDFETEDIQGRKITSKNLLGKKTLATFWSTTCPYCVNMLDDLKIWENENSDNPPSLVVFSEGSLEENRNLNLSAPVILEKDRAIASKLGMNGTPSAVLIDESGTIVSETAVGADEIWTLLGKRVEKSKN